MLSFNKVVGFQKPGAFHTLTYCSGGPVTKSGVQMAPDEEIKMFSFAYPARFSGTNRGGSSSFSWIFRTRIPTAKTCLRRQRRLLTCSAASSRNFCLTRRRFRLRPRANAGSGSFPYLCGLRANSPCTSQCGNKASITRNWRADYRSGKRLSGACSIQTTRQNRKGSRLPWPSWVSGL